MSEDLQAALLAHPRVDKARVMEHLDFDSDDKVGVDITLKKREYWPGRLWFKTCIDRELLGNTDFLISYLLNLADEAAESGALT